MVRLFHFFAFRPVAVFVCAFSALSVSFLLLPFTAAGQDEPRVPKVSSFVVAGIGSMQGSPSVVAQYRASFAWKRPFIYGIRLEPFAGLGVVEHNVGSRNSFAVAAAELGAAYRLFKRWTIPLGLAYRTPVDGKTHFAGDSFNVLYAGSDWYYLSPRRFGDRMFASLGVVFDANLFRIEGRVTHNLGAAMLKYTKIPSVPQAAPSRGAAVAFEVVLAFRVS